MKILILANNDVGLYNFRKEVLEKLLEEKHSVFIALPGGEQVVKLIKMGCCFFQMEIDRRGINPIKDCKLLITYFNLIRKIQPDIVLTYTIKPNIYGGIVCQLLKKEYITNITGLGTSIENGGITAAVIMHLYKLSLKKSACIFFQNNSNLKQMKEKKITGRKVRLIPGSGVNLKTCTYEPYPMESEPISFLFLGRVMKAKGIEELFMAATRIKKEFPTVIFYIAGACEENYIGQIKEMEQKGIVSYLGFQSETHELIKTCYALVLPSYHEGMSNVLLEASACGRPVLASKIPGCMEIYEDGVTGLGFEPQNAESLEKALKIFIDLDYEKKKQMGIYARKKVEKDFDRNIVIKAYLDEINRIAGKETKKNVI